jgi:hypothetical protein
MLEKTSYRCVRWLACILLLASTSPLHALLIESWENTGLEGVGDCQGPWTRMKEAPRGVTISFSTEHATDGNYSLAIYTPGGWVQALSNTVNFTDALPDMSLRQAMASRSMISFDVYADKSLGEASITLLLLGVDMPYTTLNADQTLRCGGSHVARFRIPQNTSEALRRNDEWFQIFFIIKSTGAGTVYLDNLRIE